MQFFNADPFFVRYTTPSSGRQRRSKFSSQLLTITEQCLLLGKKAMLQRDKYGTETLGEASKTQQLKNLWGAPKEPQQDVTTNGLARVGNGKRQRALSK